MDAKYLAGATEIGEVLGADGNTVNQWKRRYPDFPEPVLVLSGRPLWDIREVIGWARRTGRPVAKPDYEAPVRRTAARAAAADPTALPGKDVRPSEGWTNGVAESRL
ncbi:hypothetical protein ACPC54_12000 [Kitasatospora sp. NPDC094028]